MKIDLPTIIIIGIAVYCLAAGLVLPKVIIENKNYLKQLRNKLTTDKYSENLLNIFNNLPEDKKAMIYNLAVEIATPKQQLNSIYDNLPESQKQQLMNYAKALNNTPEDINL